MTDITDVESAYSKGRVEWEKFLKDFSTRFLRPLSEGMLAMFLQGITPDVEEQLGPQLDDVRAAYEKAYGSKVRR